jgi:lysophospholipase L1-like esterase
MNRLLASVVAGSLLVAASACSTSHTSSRAVARPKASKATTAAHAASLKPGDPYVALGSSFASGFGIPVQSTACGRSNRNYAHLIAQHYRLNLTDVTCGGAVIANVVDRPQGDNPPQLTAVTPNTMLVTVTVGGNDIEYNATAVVCSNPSTVCTPPSDLEAKLAATADALQQMIVRIKAVAPSATTVFVTYPREVPDGNCPALSFTDAEADIVRSMGEQLEDVFVAFAKKTDVVFVDPYAASEGHTGCAPASQRWVAGSVAPDGFPYHPTALGHEVMAEMIVKALGRS